MFIKDLQWNSIIILVVTRLTNSETISSTTESTDTAPKSANFSDVKNTSNEQEWRYNDSNEPARPADRIYSIDLATFHKYRRNGNENSPINEDHRRYFMDFPEQNQFDNDQYRHREKNRYNDDVYPVRVQSCPPYMRDVSRFQNDGNQNGILQGWLGGSRWRGKNEEEKHYPYTPSYVTTATAKMPASYNRHQDIYHKKYVNTQEKTSAPVKSRLYDSDYREYRSQGNTPKEYFNNRNPDYSDDRNNAYPYGLSSQSDRNNRIIYYEYNLDDHRRPDDSFYQRELDRNCRSGFGSPTCPQEAYMNSRHMGRSQLDGRPYTSSDEQVQSRVPAQSKSLSVMYDDNTEPPFPGYFAENSHRFRNTNRNYHRQNPGRGYVFSLDLPRDRQQIPGSAPSIYMSQLPFMNDYNKYDSTPTSSPFVPV